MNSTLPLPAPSAMVFDTAAVRPVPPNLRVKFPAGPLSARPLKVASPVGSVVATVLLSEPPVPEAMEAVIEVPPWETAFPAPSRSWTTG